MKEDIKIAFLILAHSQPAHLFRMVNTLDDRRFEFFIHIDAKEDISKFLNFSYSENVHFISNRWHVVHEGFSLVEAMICLLEEAYADPEIKYFFFLSGWDYPIKSSEYIYNFLKESYPLNFISFYPLVGKADLVRNVRKYYFIDHIRDLPRIIQRPLKILMQEIPLYRPFLPGITPFRGSAWSCISRESVCYILEYLKKEEGKTFINYYRHTFCADEMFFHTIILNSPYAPMCNRFADLTNREAPPLKNENKAYLHFIDWDRSRENPAILNLNDFDNLKLTRALFARKFHEQKSASLLSAIDQLIRENERTILYQ